MLVRITEYCTMGCSHCMINASESGTHMSIETFEDCLNFVLAFDMVVIFSGGEPTEHPDFLAFLGAVKSRNALCVILSNGSFLENDDYAKEILDFGYNIQVTNDNRFYPKPVKKIDHPGICYHDQVTLVSPFGRAVTNGITITQKYPGCFNVRSCANKLKSFATVVGFMRCHMGKFCTPSINADGSISIGESNCCGKIGTVNSTDDELLESIRSVSCNNCGLHKNLEGEFAEEWKRLNNE